MMINLRPQRGRWLPILLIVLVRPCGAGAAPAGAPAASITLTSVREDKTLESETLRAWTGEGDLGTFLSEAAGRKCWRIPAPGRVCYLYVRTKDARLQGGSMHVRVKVTALDKPGGLEIHYDGDLFPWKRARVATKNTGAWKTFTFDLPDAGFLGRCNGADFRLCAGRAFSVAAIEVELVERKRPADRFPRKFSLGNPRIVPDRLGFAHGGMFMGPRGLTREMYERELDVTQQLGFAWTRCWPEWAEIERREGEFDWILPDYKLAQAEQRGLKMLGMIGYGSRWGADAPDSVKGHKRVFYPPKKLSDLADYAFASASRYKGRVKYWETWNEPQPRTGFWRKAASGRNEMERYVALQKAVYEAVKKADPTCVVLTGGFADGPELPRELARYYELGLKGTFDVMNIHHYGGDPRGGYTARQIEAVIRVMRHYGDGDKKIWITETGWPVRKHPQRRTVRQQAQWTPWLFAVLLSYPQVERVFFYELRDRGGESFGWHNVDFTARPVVERWRAFLKTRTSSRPPASPD